MVLCACRNIWVSTCNNYNRKRKPLAYYVCVSRSSTVPSLKASLIVRSTHSCYRPFSPNAILKVLEKPLTDFVFNITVCLPSHSCQAIWLLMNLPQCLKCLSIHSPRVSLTDISGVAQKTLQPRQCLQARIVSPHHRMLWSCLKPQRVFPYLYLARATVLGMSAQRCGPTNV